MTSQVSVALQDDKSIICLTQRCILEKVNQSLRKGNLLEIEKIRVFGEVAEGWPQVKFALFFDDIANPIPGNFYLLGTATSREFDFFTISCKGLRLMIEKPIKALCDSLREIGYPNELKDWNKIPER